MEDGAKGGECEGLCCILVLCGLPASGKSSLARLLKEKLSDSSPNSNLPACNVHHICYDDLMPPDVEKQLIEDSRHRTGQNEELGTSKWREFRRAIITCTENALPKLGCAGQSGWALDTPDELQKAYSSMIQRNSPGSITPGDTVDIFIIDDNMYYAGMRYEYYKLAKKYNISFAQVCVSCSVEAALHKNAGRPVPVPEDVIRIMADRFEPPEASPMWERYSLTVDGEQDLSSEVDSIVELIRSSLEDPVSDLLAELEQQREESRSETLASTVHQVDQVLRRIVAELMKEAKESGMAGPEIKALSGKLRQHKADILQQFRSGDLELNEDELSEGFESSSTRSFFHRLKLIIQEKL